MVLASCLIDARVNPAFARHSEPVRLVGSRQRLIDALGDEPFPPLADTLEWIDSA